MLFAAVAHAFQVSVDLDHAQNEAQIDRHGLLHRQQIQRRLIDIALQPINCNFAAAYQIADREIAYTIRLNRALNGLLRQSGHHQQVLFQLIQTLLKPNARHPNLPVM